MDFNTMCRAVEKALVLDRGAKDTTERMINEVMGEGWTLRRLLQEAKLFQWATDVDVRNPVMPEDPKLLDELFALPYQVTAIADNVRTCIVAQRTDRETGVNVPRFYMSCISSRTRFNLVNGAGKDEHLSMEEGIRRHYKVRGELHYLCVIKIKESSFKGEGAGVLDLDYEAMGLVLHNKGREVLFCCEPELLGQFLQANSYVTIAYRQLAVMGAPSRFIVREKVKRATSSEEAILRESDRDQYTLLTPAQIKVRAPEFGEQASKGFTPRWRRGHWRTLTSPKFVHKMGETIWIPACYQGPTEFIKDGKQYQVVLDR